MRLCRHMSQLWRISAGAESCMAILSTALSMPDLSQLMLCFSCAMVFAASALQTAHSQLVQTLLEHRPSHINIEKPQNHSFSLSEYLSCSHTYWVTTNKPFSFDAGMAQHTAGSSSLNIRYV